MTSKFYHVFVFAVIAATAVCAVRTHYLRESQRATAAENRAIRAKRLKAEGVAIARACLIEVAAASNGFGTATRRDELTRRIEAWHRDCNEMFCDHGTEGL